VLPRQAISSLHFSEQQRTILQRLWLCVPHKKRCTAAFYFFIKKYKTMKNTYFTIIILAALSYGTAAQEAPHKAPNRPGRAIQKGYYSIGNNAEKLSSYSNPVVLSTTRTVAEPAAKGYHAIAPRERTVVVADLALNRKPVTKGYYSIGSN
jgi:hypothetical protein